MLKMIVGYLMALTLKLQVEIRVHMPISNMDQIGLSKEDILD